MVSTDYAWGADRTLRAVHVLVRADSPTGTIRDDHVYVVGMPPRYAMPLSFGVVPSQDVSAAEWIEVDGCADTDCAQVLTRQRAAVAFAPAQTVVLPVFLATACATVRCDDPLTTCRPSDRTCTTAHVDVSTLAPLGSDAGKPMPRDTASVPDVPGLPDRPEAADLANVPDVYDAGSPSGDALDAATTQDVIDASAARDGGAADARADGGTSGDAGSLSQRSCAAGDVPGCGMVRIAGGTMTMGEASIAYQGAPVQPGVSVSDFAIDRDLVTVARYRVFLAAGAPVPTAAVMYRGGAMPYEGTIGMPSDLTCFSAPNFPRTDREDHPINCVNWAEAQAFCVWDGGRLPTQAEWEFAARGAADRIYPWGTSDLASGGDRLCWSGAARRGSTCVVGSFSPHGDTPEGVHDMAGNLSEWNADWNEPYATTGAGCWTGRAITDPLCMDRTSGLRAVRDSSFNNVDVGYVRSASRNGFIPTLRGDLIGFRCARDVP